MDVDCAVVLVEEVIEEGGITTVDGVSVSRGSTSYILIIKWRKLIGTLGFIVRNGFAAN